MSTTRSLGAIRSGESVHVRLKLAIPSYRISLSKLQLFLKDKFGPSKKCDIEMSHDSWLITLPEGEGEIPREEIKKLQQAEARTDRLESKRQSSVDSSDGIAS